MRRLAALLLLVVTLTSGAPAVATELRIMVFDPTSLPEAWSKLNDLARRFEAAHPGVTVKLLTEGGGVDPLTKLRILLAAGQPLDIAILDVLELSSFLEDGLLLDLDPWLENDPAWNEDDYFPVILDAFRGQDGHLYGLPSTFTPYVFYVNETLLAEVGLEKPGPGWTWDDLVAMARRCTRTTERGRVWGLSITQWLQALAPWIWQNGGSLLDPERGVATADSEDTIGAIHFLTRLFHDEKLAATDATFQSQLTRGEFQDGNVAFYGPVGYWEVYRFKEIRDFAWDVCPLPRGKEAATSIALRSYVGMARTEHPELTAEFLRILAGEEMSRTLARIGNGVPGHIAAARSEDFLKPHVPPESEQVFLDAVEYARFLPVHASWREIEHLVQKELQDCLVLGKIDAETACRSIQRKVNAFLQREREERERPLASLLLTVGGPLLAAALLLAGFLLLRGRRPSLLARSEERAAHALLILWGAGFLILTLGPMLVSLALSLTVYTSTTPLASARWAGLDNYARLLSDEDFWQALRVTTTFTLLSVPLSLALALLLSLLLHRGSTVLRTLFHVPSIMSLVALGILFRWILGTDPVEGFLGRKWIEAEEWIVPGFVLMSLWTVGGPMLVFLAGLQGIDPVLYEAARLDGASRVRQLVHVTLPQLGPVILFNLIMGVINAFQTFAQPYVMTGGGPGNASLFYVLYLYKTAFRFQDMGYACTLGWVLLGLLLLLTLVLLGRARGRVHYEGEAP
jgi:multiple sugar transport system permease protein